MTITATGPDGYTFNFPDETPQSVVSTTIRNHYGTDQAPAAAPPTTAGMIATELGRGVPVLGPAITNRYGSTGREAWEAAHPWLSSGLQMAGGTAALALAPEAEAAAFGTSMLPSALGMTGRAVPAMLRAGASGAVLNAADAAARGEDPRSAALTGALLGAGGAGLGRGAGALYGAARDVLRPTPAAQRFLPNELPGNELTPGSQSQLATAAGQPDIAQARAEDILRKEGDPTALAHDAAADASLQRAHNNMSTMLGQDPMAGPQIGPMSGQPPPNMPQQPYRAGQAVVNDLVTQEQNRAQAEVARMAGLDQQTGQLRQTLGGGPPMATPDVGRLVGQRATDIQTNMRQATTNAYTRAANVNAAYNPLLMRNASDAVLGIVNSEPGVIRVTARSRPIAYDAIQGINDEIQAQMTLAAQRGRQFGPAEMEEVRKVLNDRRGDAIAAARQSQKYTEVAAMNRVMDAFDEWEQQLAHTPGTTRIGPDGQPVAVPGGLLHGDANEIFATRQAARAAHAAERGLFGRQGPGDAVGGFMGKLIGRYPGQELSGEGVISSLFGTPGGSIPENGAPILNRLRDVFGENSPEWRAIKQAAVAHMTEAPPGTPDVTLPKLADRIDRFLGNQRHSNAILSTGEQAGLRTIGNNVRAEIAQQAAGPAAGSPAARVAQLARGGGQALFDALFVKNGEQLVPELRQQLPRDLYNQLRQAVWRDISEAPEGMTPWGHQKSGQKISEFLTTPLAQEMFNPIERTFMQNIARQHYNLVPTPGSVNTSGSAYTAAHYLKGMQGQLIRTIARGIGTALGHFPGYLAGEAVGHVAAKVGEKVAARNAAERAIQAFVGPRAARAPVVLPQRIGATAGRLIRLPTADQAQLQTGE